jgi:geranylgeranylglycerol-phosphate geranylgeranyltransferase
MARPVNLLPSMMLVLFGAWASTGRSLLSLRAPAVWLVSLLSSSVAAASMVLNDYFDFRSGADVVNAPQKPLPRGLVTPDGALLFGFVLYIGVLLAACFMGELALRIVIALSAAATLLYTPVLKRLTGIKNATVAAVITASPLAGALAAKAGGAGIMRLVPLCTFLFMGLMYREVLMDITDVVGDREAGIRTIPVVAGRTAALGVAAMCIAVAGSLLAFAAFHSHGLAWAWASGWAAERTVRALAMLSVVFEASPVAAAILSIWRSTFDRSTISRAVDESMKSIGIGMIVLAAVL